MIGTFQSENLGELAAALAKAQAKIMGAVKDKENPYFKSLYADLGSVWDACREPLTSNGLAVAQVCVPPTGEGSTEWRLRTTLVHSSGQWMASELPVRPAKNDPQSFGSAITYSRRYALAAIAGVPQIDDDGGRPESDSAGKKGPPMAEKRMEKAEERAQAAQKEAAGEGPAEPTVKGAKGKNWMVAKLAELGLPSSDEAKPTYQRLWPLIEGLTETNAIEILKNELKGKK